MSRRAPFEQSRKWWRKSYNSVRPNSQATATELVAKYGEERRVWAGRLSTGKTMFSDLDFDADAALVRELERQDAIDSMWAYLPTPTQQAIARGELLLEDVYERITQPGITICPNCGVHEVLPASKPGSSLGLCGSCVRKRSTAVHLDILAETAALKENNAAKKSVERARRRVGLNPRAHTAEEVAPGNDAHQ